MLSSLIYMLRKHINVLIACEESQVEMQAFRDAGFNAYSCDIQKPRRGADLRYQIQDDVRPYLKGLTHFRTMDGERHQVQKWHLIIAHPPCTYLCKVSSVWMVINGQVDKERYREMEKAREFFLECLGARADFVAVENPLPMARARLPKPDCFVQPSWFGHHYTKKTLYWLRNLPPLMPECDVAVVKQFVHCSRGKYRSRTFEGIARAMATQWGTFVYNYLSDKKSSL